MSLPTGRTRTTPPARLLAVHSALDAASRLRPNAGEVHLARGILHYWGYRDYTNALKELNLAAKALPNSADVPLFIGLIKRRQGDWTGSTAKLEQARTMDPRNDTILFELTRTNYFALKRYTVAAEACDSVLVRKPDAFDFALARAKVDLAGRADLTRLQRLLRGARVQGAEPQLLAFERLELGLLERDYTAAGEALATHTVPTFNWAGYVTPREWYAGLIAAGLGNVEQARVDFEAARRLVADILASRPDDAKAYIVQAEITARLGHKAEAIAAGEHALALRPATKDAVDGIHIMGRLAGVYAQVGEPDRALQLLAVAVKAPNGPNYGSLQLEDTWDPLRDDQRFKELVALVAPRPGM
jgi:tetratricopeptide (TPR) repeat protein